MDIGQEISQIRKAYVPSQRIKKRSEYEKKARDIIQKNLSTLSWEKLYSAISLIDSDFWKEEEIDGRFFPLFGKPNRNRISTNDIGQIRNLLYTIFVKEDLRKIDEQISRLNGMGYGSASLLFYIKDKSRYNVFLRVTTKGIRAIYPEEARSLRYSGTTTVSWSLLNSSGCSMCILMTFFGWPK